MNEELKLSNRLSVVHKTLSCILLALLEENDSPRVVLECTEEDVYIEQFAQGMSEKFCTPDLFIAIVTKCGHQTRCPSKITLISTSWGLNSWRRSSDNDMTLIPAPVGIITSTLFQNSFIQNHSCIHSGRSLAISTLVTLLPKNCFMSSFHSNVDLYIGLRSLALIRFHSSFTNLPSSILTVFPNQPEHENLLVLQLPTIQVIIRTTSVLILFTNVTRVTPLKFSGKPITFFSLSLALSSNLMSTLPS